MHRMSVGVCQFTAFVMLLGPSGLMARDEAAKNDLGQARAAESSAELDVADLLTYEQAGAYLSQVTRRLETKDLQQLNNLRRNANWGVSLQAAWTSWLDDRQRLTGPFAEERLKTGASKWIGFLEGRLAVVPPQPWADAVQSIHSDVDTRDGKKRLGRAPSFFFDARGDSRHGKVELVPGLFGSNIIAASRDAKTLKVRPRGFEGELLLDIDKLKIRPLGDEGQFQDALIEWFPEIDPPILVLRRVYQQPFVIMAISKETVNVEWTAISGAHNHVGGACLPEPDHAVYIEQRENIIYLFGCSKCCVYIEGYDAKSGKLSGVFSSRLF